jgi:hypothetical protein
MPMHPTRAEHPHGHQALDRSTPTITGQPRSARTSAGSRPFVLPNPARQTRIDAFQVRIVQRGAGENVMS